MSWSEKVSKEQEAMKVWEQMRTNDGNFDANEDAEHDFDANKDADNDDYRDYEGVGGDESSVARRGDPRLGPLCRNLWQVLDACPCPLHS